MSTPGLSGYTVTRNAIRLDYPFVECIRSMLPVCNEVVVCDCDSDDGTLERLRLLAKAEPKIRVIQWPFTNPVADETWFDRWLNFTREHLSFDMQLQLDADEILDPSSYAEIRASVSRNQARLFTFVNFWLDAQHTCQWGDGFKAHLGPSSAYLNSHGYAPNGVVKLRDIATHHAHLIVYHYSSLRRREAFIEKCHSLGKIMVENYNTREYLDAEGKPVDFMRAHPDRVANSVPFTGKHPALMHEWLKERGHSV